MNASSFTQFARKSLQILGVIALVLTIALTQVSKASAQSCDPSDGVSCWSLNYDAKIATWQGPTDGSADVYENGAVLGLIRSGWKFVVPNWQVPGLVEICVGTVKAGSVQTKANCDGTDMAVAAGNITVTGSEGQSGGFRLRPAPGYGYNATQHVPSGSSDQQPPVSTTNLPSDWAFWISLFSILAMLGCATIVSVGILVGATIAAWKHGAAFGLLVLFVGGALMFFLPVIGHIVVIVTWIAAATTKPAPAQ